MNPPVLQEHLDAIWPIDQRTSTRWPGLAAEKIAEQHLNELYESVEHSPHTTHQKFYDFLVRKHNRKTYVEVKYIRVTHHSATVHFTLEQFWKLVNTRRFLIYVMTNRGCVFIKPRIVLAVARVRHMRLNPRTYNIVFRVKFSSDGTYEVCEANRGMELDEGLFRVWKDEHIEEQPDQDLGSQ